MEFRDRSDAGRALAARLEHLRDDDVVVLGLPRGGVPVAAEVARSLDAPLDIIVVRKLGVPSQPELAMGALGEGGIVVRNEEVIRVAEVTPAQLESAERRERSTLDERVARLRGGQPALALTGKTVVIVDDGIATGSTARAACLVARARQAGRVVVAVPVAPSSSLRSLRAVADEVVCVGSPEPFFAVGQWYRDFAQTSDREVRDLLRRSAARRDADEDAAGRIDDADAPAAPLDEVDEDAAGRIDGVDVPAAPLGEVDEPVRRVEPAGKAAAPGSSEGTSAHHAEPPTDRPGAMDKRSRKVRSAPEDVPDEVIDAPAPRPDEADGTAEAAAPGQEPSEGSADAEREDEASPRGAGEGRDVEVWAGSVRVAGYLEVPAGAMGMVVFAHGSGSGRLSQRNRFVASVLQAAGLGTLLFDLLTTEEERRRTEVFDIGLLAGRLAAVTRWVRSQPEAAGLRLGYFGASTGAGAALAASARPGADIAAVVSRGGRPDLAGAALAAVRCPTLLIVGSRDQHVLQLNREAQSRMRCETRLSVVPGASHLFEEEGTLAEAAELARDWFTRHLVRTAPPLTAEGMTAEGSA